MRKNAFLLVAFLFLGFNFSMAQKLKSDNIEVSIDEWVKNEKGLFGESLIVYEGVVKVQKGKANPKSYVFEYVENDGKFVIKDSRKNIIEPQISYNKETNMFMIKDVTGKPFEEEAMESGKPKLVVLSGIIFWLNNTK